MIATARSLPMILVGIGAVSAILCAAELTSKVGAVFVMTNAADKNEVIAYKRAADGSLYDGDRYETGGRGSGGLTDPRNRKGR
jgi:6-phosphogluconolactonase